MNWLHNLPLKRRLTFVILLTCSAVLLLACGLLAAYQLYDFQGIMVHDSTVLADVLAQNTQAALAFQDEKAAQQTLQALQAEPYVSAACVYTTKGNRFASYARPGLKIDFPAVPATAGHQFEQGHLVIFRPITLNNKPIGTIFLQTDLEGMYDRLRLFMGIAALVLIGSLLVALVFSARLQRPISQPILALAETARLIAKHKDYTVRAPALGRNEIGSLAESFNQLLASIEERDRVLRTANESLSGEVAERKAAETKLQAQLERLNLLHQITRAIGERQDLGSILQVVIRRLEENLPVDFSCVCLYDQSANTLKVVRVGVKSAPTAMELAMAEQSTIPIDKNGLSRCVRGQLVYEPDISQAQFPFPQRLLRGGLHSLVIAPLAVESSVFGVLVAARKQSHGFSSGECEFLGQLSEHVALASHQSQIYDALQQAYDDLRQTQQAVMQQERLRALGQMASGIAHDINNAISPVALYTQSLLEREAGLSERARNYLQTIKHAVDDVAATVARMREFYRQREPQLTLASLDLNRLAGQVIDMTRARWSDMPQQRGIVIKMTPEFANGLPAVLGVESEIREALINLVFNAVDAMPDGGTLTLRTSVTNSGPAPRVQVEVSDTGVGMNEDTRRRCLEPFFTTKGERGTGLGLAMVYGMVRRHGAELEIESAPGRGTTARISFGVPATGAAEPGQSSKAYIIPLRLRILVVDDDPLLLKSLRDTLEEDGHMVVAANGGQKGIETFREAQTTKEPFSVVITDLGMPYVDGRQVAGAVKRLSPSTPVIMLTGWGQRLIEEKDVPAHVDRVLNKPPALPQLREALAYCCHSVGS